MSAPDTAIQAQRAGKRSDIAGMIRVDLPTGAFGVIHADFPHDFGGISYKPVPQNALRIDNLGHGTGLSARRFNIVVSASKDDRRTDAILAEAELHEWRGAIVLVHDLHFDTETGAILEQPEPVQSGRIIRSPVRFDPSRGRELVFECRTGFADMSATNARMASHEDQQRRAPGDRLFAMAARAPVESIPFGRD